jgi:hypothetical protein
MHPDRQTEQTAGIVCKGLLRGLIVKNEWQLISGSGSFLFYCDVKSIEMEQNSDQSQEMHVDYDGGNILKETVRWTKFISIVGFVGIGLMGLVIIILGFAGSAIFAYYEQIIPGIAAYQAIVIMFCVIFLGIFAFLVVKLYRFSTLTRKAIEVQDQDMFNKGLQALKVYFTVGGIIAVVGLLINLVSLKNLF